MTTSIPDLVALLYRADWTQLSLAARITWRRDPDVDLRLAQRHTAEIRRVVGPLPKLGLGPKIGFGPEWQRAYIDRQPRHSDHQVLLAPGGRCRVEAPDGSLVSVRDGAQSWRIAAGKAVQVTDVAADKAFHGLLTPQWLVASYQLEVTGEELAAGRPAIRVRGAQRAVRQRHGGSFRYLDCVTVLVDAELGILLASEQVFEGLAGETAELTDLVTGPALAGDPGLFAPPPGMPVTAEEWLADRRPAGLGWQIAGLAASGAASAMGFAVRHAPRPSPAAAPGDEEPQMPAGARLPAADWAPGEPPADTLLSLLHRTGRPAPALTAQVHQWANLAAAILRMRALGAELPPRLAGAYGPDALWAAVDERAAGYHLHRVARLRAAMPDRYRLDYLSGNWVNDSECQAIAADGEHGSKLVGDRVAVGPARPLAADFAALLDPAWLLSGWRLLSASPVRLAGRPGFRLLAESTGAADDSADNGFDRVEAVVDAELAVLLRLTTYTGSQPSTRTELRELAALRGDTAAADFRIEPAPGTHAMADTRGPLAGRDLPQAVKAAAAAASLAAGGAVAGAVVVTGWLQEHRAHREKR